MAILIAYGGTATEGVRVYVFRDVDGTNYEAVIDNPWTVMMAYATSVSRRKTFFVPGDQVSRFKIHLTNDAGAQVTATVTYQQFTLDDA